MLQELSKQTCEKTNDNKIVAGWDPRFSSKLYNSEDESTEDDSEEEYELLAA